MNIRWQDLPLGIQVHRILFANYIIFDLAMEEAKVILNNNQYHDSFVDNYQDNLK